MRWTQVLVVLTVVIMGIHAAPLNEKVVVERQVTSAAGTELQVVALIHEYNLQDWCKTWIHHLNGTRR
jgi:hypothetical protein